MNYLPILLVVGGVVVALGVVWLVNRFGRSAGAAQQQATDLQATVETQQAMAQADANAPNTVEGVADAADKGTF